MKRQENSLTQTALLGCAVFAVFAICGVSGCDSISRDQPPSIIIILTDDQGYADVGVYGATGFETPHLDRMASEGLRFTSFYATESACSPTRASLMTGSYPVRAGVHDVLFPGATQGLSPDEITIAEVAKQKAYATAAIGKWHLGDHPTFLPTNQGFDMYFGIPYSNDMSPRPRNNPWAGNREKHPELPLVRDTTVVEREPDQTFLTKRYTDEALSFIEDNHKSPFLLYLAHSMPHAPLYASDDFAGETARGLYGDVIAEIDWSVGQVMETLRRLEIDDNTFVFFTSDNGPWLLFGNHGGSAGPFREGKATTFEGGHRVPAIAWMPGKIAAGTTTDHLATTMDLLPTVAGLVDGRVPTDRVIDGRDLRGVLFDSVEVVHPYDEFFFYRGGKLEAVRSGNWKLHVPHWYLKPATVGNDGAAGTYNRIDMPLALFDLSSDPGEETDVQDQNPAVVERLMAQVERARVEIGDRLTGHTGTLARPAGEVEKPWSQNPVPNLNSRADADPAQDTK